MVLAPFFRSAFAIRRSVGVVGAVGAHPRPTGRRPPGPFFISLIWSSSPSRSAFAVAGSLLWVRIFDELAQRNILDQKLSRKVGTKGFCLVGCGLSQRKITRTGFLSQLSQLENMCHARYATSWTKN